MAGILLPQMFRSGYCCSALFLRLVKEPSEKENVTENVKATDQMAWVQKINNIRNRATEIVNAEIIYAV